MPIVYSAIAYNGEIECEFQAETGGFGRVVEMIMARMPPASKSGKSHRKSYLYDGFSYNYLRAGNLVYFGVCDAEFQQRIVWVFLRKMRDLYEEDEKPPKHFDEVLEKRMKYYSYDPRADKIRAVREQVHQVQDIMMENIETVLRRGESLDDILYKTEEMNVTSSRFQEGTRVTLRKYYLKNIKLCGCIICLCIVLVIVLLVIISIAANYIGVK